MKRLDPDFRALEHRCRCGWVNNPKKLSLFAGAICQLHYAELVENENRCPDCGEPHELVEQWKTWAVAQ